MNYFSLNNLKFERGVVTLFAFGVLIVSGVMIGLLYQTLSAELFSLRSLRERVEAREIVQELSQSNSKLPEGGWRGEVVHDLELADLKLIRTGAVVGGAVDERLSIYSKVSSSFAAVDWSYLRLVTEDLGGGGVLCGEFVQESARLASRTCRRIRNSITRSIWISGNLVVGNEVVFALNAGEPLIVGVPGDLEIEELIRVSGGAESELLIIAGGDVRIKGMSCAGCKNTRALVYSARGRVRVDSGVELSDCAKDFTVRLEGLRGVNVGGVDMGRQGVGCEIKRSVELFAPKVRLE